MNPDGPYVSVAALCENVLDEKDGRVSCIRFLDRIDLNLTSSKPLQPEEVISSDILPMLQLSGLLAIKSGNFIGKKLLTINIVKPSGGLMKIEGQMMERLPLVFEGGEHGAQIILKLALKVDEEGLYYFDFLLEEEVVARIPLRVSFTYTQIDAPPPESLKTADKEEGR